MYKSSITENIEFCTICTRDCKLQIHEFEIYVGYIIVDCKKYGSIVRLSGEFFFQSIKTLKAMSNKMYKWNKYTEKRIEGKACNFTNTEDSRRDLNVSIGESIGWQNCSVVNYRSVIERERERVRARVGRIRDHFRSEELGGVERDRCAPLGSGSGGVRKKCGRRWAHIGSREKSQSVTGRVFSGVVNDWVEPLVLKNELARLRWQAAARI